MSKKQYIARVIVITHDENGKRVEIMPGKPLPDNTSDHDITELLRMDAIKDPAADKRAEQVDAYRKQQGVAEFEAAREAVIAANASTEVHPLPSVGTDAGTDTSSGTGTGTETGTGTGTGTGTSTSKRTRN